MQGETKFLFPVPTPATAWICALNVPTLRNFLVPVGSAVTILNQIVSIIEETAQKE